MEDFIKILNSFKDSCLLIKGNSETVQNYGRKQKCGIFGMSRGTLDTTLLGNMLAGKGVKRAGDGIIRAVYGSKDSLENKDF